MKRTTLFCAAALLAPFAPATAFATGDISCQGVDGSDATVELGIGTLPILSIISATVSANGQVWTTQPGKGETEIIVGHQAIDGNLLIADFTDVNITGIVIAARLLEAEENGDFVRAGTLKIAGQGAHAVVCIGP